MVNWQVEAVHYDFPDAGKVSSTFTLEADDRAAAIAAARAKLGSALWGATLIVTEDPKLGSRGQLLCDMCRQCRFGYHCGPCSKAWRDRARSRSQTRAHQRRELGRS